MDTKHGSLWTDQGASLESLKAHAVEQGLTHLWIMTGSRPGEQSGQFKAYTNEQTGRLRSLQAGETQVIWLSETDWNLPPDWQRLSQTIAEIEGKLGVPMHAHPGVTGLSYLRKVDERYYWKYFALPEKIEWPMIRSVSVSAIAEMKPLKAVQLVGQWLWCYDRNSSHPYAASQIKAGIGQPVAVQGIEFDHLAPGFWCCDISGQENLWNGLPLIPTHNEWLPTPIVKMAWQRGCKVKVHEAYIWPDKKDRAPVFSRWAHNLWDLRESYAPGTPERETVKGIMNRSVGLLRRKSAEDKNFRDYRPDWYSLILAEERAVVWYKAFQVFQATGIAPVGCYHDALYYCADQEIEALTTRVDKDGATHSTKHSLGGYKVDWKLPLCDEVKAILMAPLPKSASDRIGELKKWGRQHGYIA